jgi:hypothetical protein
MSEAPLKTLQFRVETLPSVYSALVKALGEMELSGVVINELITKQVSAACVLCDIQVEGDDLSAVALAAHAGKLTEARLARLKQGYCCRRSCDSYYYNLVFAPHPAVNWEEVVKQVAGAKMEIGSAEADPAAALPRMDPARRALVIKVAAGIGLVLVLLLCKHLMSGGSLPGLHRASKYTVDPNSLPTIPGR